MKNIVLGVLIAITFNAHAQHSISGTFTPQKEYSWLIAYHLRPGSQVYIADTAIKEGKFTLDLSETSPTGSYRIVYALPQEEFYFDIIYNGKEDIELSFDSEKGVSFIASEENKLFSSYFKEINASEIEIITFYAEEKSDLKAFETILEKSRQTQASYEAKSEGLLAHHFIRANKSYIPKKNESIQDYVKHKKQNYFNALDFKNSVLQASGFLTDKLTNYVCTALPFAQLTRPETEKVMQANIETVNIHLNELEQAYKLHLFYTLWTRVVANGFNDTSDFIYESYIKHLVKTTKDQEIITAIETHNRLRLGAVAPEIIWNDGLSQKKLSTLEGAQNYVLIFWSSTCSHCLKELPPLHKKFKEKPLVKVLAVGLEDDDVNWKKESAKLGAFEHAIALGRWESEYATLYDIHQTPTYFILDKDKRILAKFDHDKDVIDFFEER
ncbi:MAG: thiol:disulfide interchange protein [Maribacter sp.]|nr:MAG: thiol:disulfide interchange protein [Maribacter sp.]